MFQLHQTYEDRNQPNVTMRPVFRGYTQLVVMRGTKTFSVKTTVDQNGVEHAVLPFGTFDSQAFA